MNTALDETLRLRGQKDVRQPRRRDACLSERTSLVLWKEGDWRCEFNPGLAELADWTVAAHGPR